MKIVTTTKGFEVKVDDEDFEKVSKFKWHLHNRGYAQNRHGPGLMHRFIMNAKREDEVDHINGDRLDNQKQNLRCCSHQSNMFNSSKHKNGTTSKFKGVYLQKGRRNYGAAIKVNYRTVYLGSFNNETDATKAYDKSAEHNFGKFAKLNFPNV